MSTEPTIRSLVIQMKSNRTRAGTILRDLDVMLDKNPSMPPRTRKALLKQREAVQGIFDSLQVVEEL